MVIMMIIHNIRLIKDFSFEFFNEKGIYALTGYNASGKRAVISCATTAFYNPIIYPYFSTIMVQKKNLVIQKKQTCDFFWKSVVYSSRKIRNYSFFVEHLIFGGRFKDIFFGLLKRLYRVPKEILTEASNIIEEFGIIPLYNSS